jgi:hypothetical protein
MYTNLTYFSYQQLLFARRTPDCTTKWMSQKKMHPKRKLDKYLLDYALNIKVPKADQEEFDLDPITTGPGTQFIEEKLSLLPQKDNFEEFAPGDDPVSFVMKQVGNIYPSIYQVWTDKLSDLALTRFCLYGIGAHRVDVAVDRGISYYVVRTNVLSSLPVRKGFARYGGDAYFDMDWRPVKIIDDGYGPLREDGTHCSVETKPGDPRWEEAKFRFRSSLSVLVTLVDHLYGVHLQSANILVTAVREQLSCEHPMRRFLTPFTYQTISINDNARNNLLQPRSMAPRCFAFTEQGLHLAFAAAPRLIVSGMEVPPEEGGPIFNRADYVDYLKRKKGIDTEYTRQSKRYWLTCRKFVVDYIACYYPSHGAFAMDEEIQAMFKQLLFQLEFISPSLLGMPKPTGRFTESKQVYTIMVDLIADFMFIATAGHEQVGAIEAYVQDASFCAFKWTHGSLIGTKQTATAQALLMSFTSTPMPRLLGSDWTHLFPSVTNQEAEAGAAIPVDISPAEETLTAPPPQAIVAFRTFQEEMHAMSADCEAYNEAAATRPFPECFPLYVLDPKRLETSISV